MPRAVAWMVEKLKRKVDFRPFADLFEAFCTETSEECYWTGEDEDWALLLQGPREQRLGLLEWAIRTGSLELPHRIDDSA